MTQWLHTYVVVRVGIAFSLEAAMAAVDADPDYGDVDQMSLRWCPDCLVWELAEGYDFARDYVRCPRCSPASRQLAWC